MLTKGGSVPDCVDTGLSHPGGCTYTYDPATLQLATETTPVGLTAATRTLTWSYDALLRPTGYELKNGSTVETSAAQTYDAAGRLATVVHHPHSATPRTFTYGYTSGRPHLLTSVTGPVHTVLKSWEAQRDVLSQISNEIAGSPVSRYTYTVNSLGQRTAVATTGSAFGGSPANWTWGYNAKGEVTSATHGSTAGRSLAWTFDDIGNRLTQSVGTTPANTSYTTNLLNQYTTIGHPTPSTETPVHDLDGNLIQDATKKYVWDAENRLKQVLRASDDAVIASYQYDHLGRRVRKTTTTLAPQNATDSAYVYDGWNVVVEYAMGGGFSFVSRTRTWGLDLSGSLQGAGGVGRLLADGDAIGGVWYATYDGNGNVSEYLSKTGVTSTHYEYDAFGNTVFASGALGAPSFSCRFSTKPLDMETGWYYYGYRYYDAVKGRWLNRDPIGEKGGLNLYGMVGNDVVGNIDPLGLSDYPGGHHIVVAEIWKKWKKGPARDFFKNLTMPVNDEHAWNKDHKKYNEEIKKLWENFKKTNNIRKAPNEEQARLFARKVLESENAAIDGFLRKIAKVPLGKRLKGFGGKIVKKVTIVIAIAGAVGTFNDAQAAGRGPVCATVYAAIDLASPIGGPAAESDLEKLTAHKQRLENINNFIVNTPNIDENLEVSVFDEKDWAESQIEFLIERITETKK